MHFVLEPCGRPVPIDNQGGDKELPVEDAFGSEDHREIRFGSGRCNSGPGVFQECRIRRRDPLAHEPVARDETFRKADKAGLLKGRLRDGLFRQGDGLLGRRRELDVGECDSE